jgi:thiol-disulfide isomerase/thioredoxin
MINQLKPMLAILLILIIGKYFMEGDGPNTTKGEINKVLNITKPEIKQKKSEKKEDKPQVKKEDKLKAIFKLTPVNKDELTIKIYEKKRWDFGEKNKVVLLKFFGTWCPPSKKQIPILNKIKETYKDKIRIISLDIGNNDGTINTDKYLKDFIEKHKIKYIVTKGKVNNSLFWSIANEVNRAGSSPFMVLFDKNGMFIKPYIGLTPEQQLQIDINKLIKRKR